VFWNCEKSILALFERYFAARVVCACKRHVCVCVCVRACVCVHTRVTCVCVYACDMCVYVSVCTYAGELIEFVG